MKNKLLKCMGLAVVSLVVPLCTSCNIEDDGGKLKIVTSVYSEYDWVMTVLGDKKDNASVRLLRDSGIDMHSYQPSMDDAKAISKCDLLVYVGGESDDWIEDAVKDAANKDKKVINLLETLGDGAKKEETVEGMQGEEEHEHEGEEEYDHEGEGEEEVEYDEHVWLSVKNAQIFVTAISDALGQIDAGNAAYYKSNADSYVNQLKDLDNRYTAAVSAGEKDTILFGDRFPFRYMVEDYNLKYYAAFLGCSSNVTPDYTTIKFLAEKIDELNLKVILKIEGNATERLISAIKETANTKDLTVLTMDSIQSARSSDFKNENARYLSIMENNLGVLKEALK